MKPKWSEIDSRGYLNVDCSECSTGINGSQTCSSGSKSKFKKGGVGSCFMGALLPKFDIKKVKVLS